MRGAVAAGRRAGVALVDRDVAPRDDALSLRLDRLGQELLERCGARLVPGQEADRDAVEAEAAEARRRARRERARPAAAASSPRRRRCRASAPSAPRCSRLASAVAARTTVSWLATPSSRATNATPQASCSYAGS